MSGNPYSDMSGGNQFQPSQFGLGGGGDYEAARAKVQAPAMTLLITTAVFMVLRLVLLVLNLMGVGMIAAAGVNDPQNGQAMANAVGGTVGSIIALVCSGLVLFGAWKMKSLESRSMAMAASILAMIPCTSPCCLVGLPVGIWCVMTLNDPVVKAVYR